MTLRTIGHKLQPSTRCKVRPAPKRADPIYSDPRYIAARAECIRRAGGRCQKIRDGKVCGRAEKRMFADHVKELRDGGDPFDPAQLECTCGSCHTRKTADERAKRLGLTRG